MKIILRSLMVCLLLSSCASNQLKEPTAAERSEEVAKIKTQLAVEYMNVQNYREAVKNINAALKSDERFTYAWLIGAQIWQYLKEPNKAEESFRRALALAPNSAEVNNNYGWFLCDVRNNPNAGMPYFDRALADPTYPSPEVANLNKGVCSSKMGQYQLAQSYFERALAANPNFLAIKKEMARNYLRSGSLQEADYLFRQYQSQVAQLNADDLLLGWEIARAQGQSQAAYEYEAQLRGNYPYSLELEKISIGSKR